MTYILLGKLYSVFDNRFNDAVCSDSPFLKIRIKSIEMCCIYTISVVSVNREPVRGLSMSFISLLLFLEIG